jgi:anaerobic selenocysteine-containing dehydrogenase
VSTGQKAASEGGNILVLQLTNGNYRSRNRNFFGQAPRGDADPGWVRISWDEAMELTASRLLDITTHYGAEAVVFGIGTPAGPATADYWDWLLRLANAFGSSNFTDPIYICAWNWFFGSQYTYGVTRPPPDYDQARCILLWGHNPEASWPAPAAHISQARARGAKLIVIDPRQHSLAQKADCWLQVRPGSDGALALVPPLHESRLDLEILFDLAKRLGMGAHFKLWDSCLRSAPRTGPSPDWMMSHERILEYISPCGKRIRSQTLQLVLDSISAVSSRNLLQEKSL